jgi:hypothetical protein
MATAYPTSTCPSCGAPRFPGAQFCRYCGSALPSPTAPPLPLAGPAPADTFQLVDTVTLQRRTLGYLGVWIGVGLVVFGILLLVGAVIAHQGTASFNQACSQNPECQPAPDPSPAIAAAGVLLLLIGIGVAAFAAYNASGARR